MGKLLKARPKFQSRGYGSKYDKKERRLARKEREAYRAILFRKFSMLYYKDHLIAADVNGEVKQAFLREMGKRNKRLIMGTPAVGILEPAGILQYLLKDMVAMGG